MGPSGSFSIDVIRRILLVLREEPHGISTTNLASKTGLNYYACVRYLEFLNLLRWVVGPSEGSTSIHITETGRAYMTLLVSETSRADAGRENSDLSSARVKKSKNNVLFDEGWHPTNEPKHLDTEDRLPNGGNIMIIDDEPDLLVSYKLNLAELGVDCFATTDPSVALQEFAKDVSKYDLVISDIRMKSINGFQVYKQLKGLRPNIKIILVSALDIPSEIFSIIPGFRKDDFVAKPIERNTLVQKVRAALSESE